MKRFNHSESSQIFWNWFRSHWSDPNATPELAAHYRARQIDSLARQLPLASLATVFIVVMCFIVDNGDVNAAFLTTWSITLFSVAFVNLILWYLIVHKKIANNGSYKIVWTLTFTLGLAALLYTQMIVLLLGKLDASGQVILVALVAAYITTGAWQFAAVALAGTVWVFILCIGVSVGFLVQYGSDYIFLSSLLVIYWIYLSCAVMLTSQRFVAGLMAETAIEHQRQVVGLLLRDFEENASDWLWETDAQGRLTHVSPRMESVMGKPAASLLGKYFVRLLKELVPVGAEEAAKTLQTLSEHIEQEQPFTVEDISLCYNNQVKWLKITAQPLTNERGVFAGWRGVASDVTDALLREREMIQAANIDSLTGLANRHRFGKTLNQCFIGEGQLLDSTVTLITLDLDNFKAVNDTLGHLAGDELLKEVAERFKTITPDDITIARLGGDEFAWIISNGFTPLQSDAFGQKILAALSEPWLHQEHSFDLSASIGVANAPIDGNCPVSLQRASDMALYAAKNSGKNKLCFYDTKLDEYAMMRLALINDFRQSFSNQDFVVHYQPQIRLSDNALVGFEALVRWHHPERGIVSPSDFIPLIEENGMIVPLGEWVLNQACADAMLWPKALSVAVNVSPVQIERTELLTTVKTALTKHGLPAQRLELELTESSLMCDGDKTIALLNDLRQFGVRIALDDFGTGYSSLAYLQRFPIDKLKVDRNFVIATSQHDIEFNKSDAKSILHAIINLAQALNLETIAEGVETKEMAELLSSLGFESAQGFYYGRPMTAKQAEQLMLEWSH